MNYTREDFMDAMNKGGVYAAYVDSVDTTPFTISFAFGEDTVDVRAYFLFKGTCFRMFNVTVESYKYGNITLFDYKDPVQYCYDENKERLLNYATWAQEYVMANHSHDNIFATIDATIDDYTFYPILAW